MWTCLSFSQVENTNEKVSHNAHKKYTVQNSCPDIDESNQLAKVRIMKVKFHRTCLTQFSHHGDHHQVEEEPLKESVVGPADEQQQDNDRGDDKAHCSIHTLCEVDSYPIMGCQI